jgi:tRNA A-37 threonylcarbamoyl transferase component Bud32
MPIYCPKCGALNRDTARFCVKCSGPLAPTSPPVTPGRSCAACGTLNASQARFCKSCGQPLLVSAPPPPGAAATGMLPANSMLAGRYLILQRVGQGGMGAVYKAVDTRLHQRLCAVKEMSSASLSTVERQLARANFEREAKMLASLNHPNLPRVTDYFSEGGRHYMVMDFIEGQTLLEHIDATGRAMSEAEVRSVAGQLCAVLHYLHSQQPPVIFRDMKPGNVMLQPDGQVKLIDFGIVRFFKPGKQQDTQLLGTPGFTSPEATYGQTDARSDVYSLGMTLYCLLTAKDPPQHLAGFDPCAELAVYASPELCQAILKALEFRPENRWQTTGEMHQAVAGPGAIPRPAAPLPTPAPGGIRGATQRLTQSIARQVQQMSNAQLAATALALVVGIGLITWLVGPWIRTNLPWLWRFLPIYYAAGPFAYAVSHRKGAIALVHTPLHVVVAALTWNWINLGPYLLTGLAGAAGMEAVLSFLGGAKPSVWHYVAAPAVGITLAMGLTALLPGGYFDVVQIAGAGLAGAIAYAAGEAVWGVRQGVQTS